MGRKQETIVIYDETDDLGEITFQSGTKISIRVKKVKGALHAQLFGHTGQQILRNVRYSCIGPYDTRLEGTTDSEGILKHDDVPLGDYETRIDGEYTTNIPAIQSGSEIHYHLVEEWDDAVAPADDEEETFDEPDIADEPNPTFERNMSYEDFLNPPE